MFQAQPSTFDTGGEDQLAWDEIRYDDILATMEGAPQQADELGASQLTQPPLVLTQPSQLAADRATTVGGATPAAGGATPDVAGSSQAAMETPSPDHLRPRVVRAPDPWTYDRDGGTTPGLTLELLGGRGADAFRCNTMILYKLFPL
jgi:hypothetical protein